MSIVPARHAQMSVLRHSSVIVVAIMLGALSLGVVPALAHRNHVLGKAFGAAGSGAGQMELVAPKLIFEEDGEYEGETTGGSEVAVDDATHDVYVADTGNHRVDEFSASGAFVLAFGREVDATTKGDVCTAASKDVCQAGVPGSDVGELETPTFIAVDNAPGGEGDVYVGDTGDDLISKFTSEGKPVALWGDGGQLSGPPGEDFDGLDGIAVGPSGNLWVVGYLSGEPAAKVMQFGQAGAFSLSWGIINSPEPSGLAVNGAEELYFAGGGANTNVYKYTANGVPLGITFNDDGQLFGEPFEASNNATGLAVNPVTQQLYLDRAREVSVVTGSCPEPDGPNERCVVAESFGEPALQDGAGMAIDPEGTVVYATDATADQIDAFEEEQAGAPSVLNDAVEEVNTTGALLNGEVKLRSLSGEGDTKYYFEYGVCAAPSECPSGYEADTPVGELTPSFEEEAIAVRVGGLRQDTTYHYRLIAEDELSEKAKTPGVGEEHVFTTQSAGGFTLPDDRQWEMVSPVQKLGALIEPIRSEGGIQASANGDAITYHANAPVEPEPQGAMEQVQILSTRGPEGWSTRDIEPPHGLSDKPENGGEPYRFFSEDLSLALLQPAGAFEPALSAEASETSPMLRTDYLNGEVAEPCLPKAGMRCYRPLVTGKEGYANVPPGTRFGEEYNGAHGFTDCPQAAPFCGPKIEGASPNGEHVVITSYTKLTEASVPAGIPTVLYEWNAGQLTLVSELPPPGGAVSGGLGDGGKSTRHAISPDGSRVVWTYENPNNSSHEIFLRDTNPLSSGDPNAQTTTLIGSGEFQTANGEVTDIFFTSGGELFEYKVGAVDPLAPMAAGAELVGPVIGASEDGSYVYFAGNGQLGLGSQGAVKGDCTGTSPNGLCNLYVFHDGVTKLVAVLSGADQQDWARSPQGGLFTLTARVSPNGRFLAFMSDRDLTGYDNRDTRTGEADEEVYLYDAETGRLACASCEPTGARPRGEKMGADPEQLVGGAGVWTGFLGSKRVGLAADVPGWTPFGASGRRREMAYQSRYLSDGGRLFFNSDDGLVPRDGNGTWDVYEYEPEGVGPQGARCAPAAASGSDVFKPARDADVEGRTVDEGAGCVALISAGTSNEESVFLDASEGGGDVFFLTTAKLAPQDSDTAFDVYDAHECTASSPCTPASVAQLQACETESACKAAPSPQPAIFGAPSSATFFGEGDLLVTPPPAARSKPPLTRAQKLEAALKTCRQDKHRTRRVACEKLARRRYAAKATARKANHHRRAGS